MCYLSDRRNFNLLSFFLCIKDQQTIALELNPAGHLCLYKALLKYSHALSLMYCLFICK